MYVYIHTDTDTDTDTDADAGKDTHTCSERFAELHTQIMGSCPPRPSVCPEATCSSLGCIAIHRSSASCPRK